jgi:hypothetical protein
MTIQQLLGDHKLIRETMQKIMYKTDKIQSSQGMIALS